VGTGNVLASLGPLLQHPNHNPHACLLGLYLNAVHEVSTAADELAALMTLEQYIPINKMVLMMRDPYNADSLNFSNAKGIFKDFDGLFQRYMERESFEEICKFTGMVMKATNTVIQPWPLRLSKTATQKDFYSLHKSAHDGSERYVEWKRAS